MMTSRDLSPTITGATPIEALPALIVALEAAASGTRELDGEIYWLVERNRALRAYWNAAFGMPKELPDSFRPTGLGLQGVIAASPHFTTSLDAAVALIGRVLPDYWWLSRSDEVEGGYGNLGPIGTSPNSGGPGYPSYARTAPIALCLATLRALTSQASGEGE